METNLSCMLIVTSIYIAVIHYTSSAAVPLPEVNIDKITNGQSSVEAEHLRFRRSFKCYKGICKIPPSIESFVKLFNPTQNEVDHAMLRKTWGKSEESSEECSKEVTTSEPINDGEDKTPEPDDDTTADPNSGSDSDKSSETETPEEKSDDEKKSETSGEKSNDEKKPEVPDGESGSDDKQEKQETTESSDSKKDGKSDGDEKSDDTTDSEKPDDEPKDEGSENKPSEKQDEANSESSKPDSVFLDLTA